MFALEVEFLTGVSASAAPYRRDESEWPPHPDRLFQALVAAWGRNEKPSDDERVALEWLEKLDHDTIVISAPAAAGRDVVSVFVPPNDLRTTKGLSNNLQVIPEFRKNRQPRAFPASLPASERPVVRYIWKGADGVDGHRIALQRMAAEVTYLGHSHTLVRVALIETVAASDLTEQTWIGRDVSALRMPYEGRLAQLIECHDGGVRPNPSLVLKNFGRSAEPAPPHTLFDADNVTILVDEGGFVPALEAFPLVAKRFRDALLWTAKQNGLSVPALLSGHDPGGMPATASHIAIVPLADVGWKHSSGRLMGLALLWPDTANDEERKQALTVLASFLRHGYSDIHFGHLGSWRVGLEPDSNRASLRFERYARAARCWTTVLPIALDRHPKDRTGADLAAIVARACLNVGLKEQTVDGIDIEVSKYGSVTGAPSARLVMDTLAKDSPYRGRPLHHMVLTFAKPVKGPLILGAGRFRGLGLCLPFGEGTP